MRPERSADRDHVDFDRLDRRLLTLRQATVQDVVDDVLRDHALASLDDREDLRGLTLKAEHELQRGNLILAVAKRFFESFDAFLQASILTTQLDLVTRRLREHAVEVSTMRGGNG